MNLIICLLICGCALIVNAQRIEHPTCPIAFKYIYTNLKEKWVGFGRGWTTQEFRNHNVTIDVTYATAKLNDTKNLGSIKILQFRIYNRPQTQKRWNVIYEVKFPIQDPLPEVTKILFNGDVHCEDKEKEFSEEKPDLVTLHLQFNALQRKEKYTSEIITKTEPNQEPTSPAAPTTPALGINLQSDHNDSFGCGTVVLPRDHASTVKYSDRSTIERGTWPWLVTIYAYSNRKLGFKCAATLISHKLIVTAAHCFFDNLNRKLNTEDVVVILGQYSLKKPQDPNTKIAYPESINIHPNYQKRSRIDSDIAVVVLPNHVPFTYYIRPACLRGEPEKYFDVNRRGLTAGWGRDENGSFFSDLPIQVELQVVSDEMCLRSHQAFSAITSRGTFCAGSRNSTKKPCNGDSGGPLIFHNAGSTFGDSGWTLGGVISTSRSTDGSNTCNLNEYVVFTDISKFTSWITSFSDEEII